MANLLEIAELCYRQIFPVPRDKTAITLVEFVQTAKVEYAAAMWIYRQEQINLDGYFQMPSDLLTEVELDIVNNQIDISSLKYLSALQGDLWLQSLSGAGKDCDCKFIKSNINLSQLLCDDDSMPSSFIPYYVQGKKIKFEKRVPVKKATIVYANTGTSLNEKNIEVNEYIGSKVRDKLTQIYSRRLPADVTNNQNVDQ